MNDPVLNKLLSEITNQKYVGGGARSVISDKSMDNQEEKNEEKEENEENEEKEENEENEENEEVKLLSNEQEKTFDNVIELAKERDVTLGRGLEKIRDVQKDIESNENVQKILKSVGGVSGLLIIFKIIKFIL